MKRYSLFLALTALMVFSFGLAHGQSDVVLTSVDGLFGSPTSDTVKLNTPLKFMFGLHQNTGYDLLAFTMGYQVYTKLSDVSPYTTPGYFDPIVLDTVPIGPSGWVYVKVYNPLGYFDNILFNLFSVDGMGRDTAGVGGVWTTGDAPGFPNGYSLTEAWFVTTQAHTDGDTICIDSSYYPPGSPWIWSLSGGTPPSMQPAWYGPHCFHVYFVPDQCPLFSNCPASTISHDHCLPFTLDLDAADPDPENDAVLYRVENDGGLTGLTVGLNNGVVSYGPTIGNVGNTYAVTIEAYEADLGPGACLGNACTFNVTFTNVAPGFTGGCGVTVPIGMGNTATHTMSGEKVDCDPFHFSVGLMNPTPDPLSSYNIHPTSGLITFNTTAPGDGEKLFTLPVYVSDGIDSIMCEVYFDVLKTEPFEVQIEKTHLTLQGQHEYVDVYMNKGSEQMGGFDMLMAYDRSALNFQKVMEGDLYTVCGWEYFNYRTWFWPSYEPHFFWGGIVKVVAIADMNNGAIHPSCFKIDTKPYVLFTIDFLVTDNRLFECQFAPINFFWTDCGDNTISSKTGDTLFVSRYVYSFSTGGDISDPYTGFPTYTGVQAECLVGGGQGKPAPVQFIDFINGGVDIACAADLDARGDINLNGLVYEIADAVVFTNYFIQGMGAFHVNVMGQIAATDCNADGLTLTVGDLVYLIRVIVGDALPYPKLAPVEANYMVNNGVISVDAEMGAAFVAIEGDVTPTLLADNMDMKYAYDASENITRVLVYSYEGNGFNGEFINANGNVVSIELGSYEGAVVKATEIPANFALNQNYPNPFNPTTTISFNLPVATNYTLTVYNVTGQQIDVFAGSADAGTVAIDVDASNWASGIYFYKLNAGDFSATKKMVLLK